MLVASFVIERVEVRGVPCRVTVEYRPGEYVPELPFYYARAVSLDGSISADSGPGVQSSSPGSAIDYALAQIDEQLTPDEELEPDDE